MVALKILAWLDLEKHETPAKPKRRKGKQKMNRKGIMIKMAKTWLKGERK